MIASNTAQEKPRTTQDRPAEPATANASSTAARSTRRRGAALRWMGASLLLIVAALTLLGLNGTAQSAREPLHPEHASPEGAKALVQVLNDHGVPVRIAHGRDDASHLLSTNDNSTLVITAPAVPSDAAMESILELVSVAGHTVFLVADEKVLADVKLGEVSAYEDAELVTEQGSKACSSRKFASVGEIRAQVFFEPSNEVTGCFANADGKPALLVAPANSEDIGGTAEVATVSLLDATELFDNAHLAENGNAALAFALLGGSDQVVWYVASPEDVLADRAGTIAALTPTWVTPIMLLLLFTVVVAGVWRGRRFGPLVEERLPVTVRATETMLGRARLAARGGDAAHAAAALREGATRRLAKKLGLPRTATPEQIGRAVPGEPLLMQLMTGPLPADDSDLMRFARALGAIQSRIDPQPNAKPFVPAQIPPNTSEERSTP